MLLMLLFITSTLLLLFSIFSEPLYCMDSLTDARDQLLARISQAEGKIEYFSEQAKETDRLFKEALRDNLPENVKQEALEAKKDSETNLNVERKVLRTLKNRLDSGDYNTTLSTTSSLGKRNFDE